MEMTEFTIWYMQTWLKMVIQVSDIGAFYIESKHTLEMILEVQLSPLALRSL